MRYDIGTVSWITVSLLLTTISNTVSTHAEPPTKQISAAGHALSFAGGHFASIPHQPILNLSSNNQLTLEAWVRRNSEGEYWQMVMTKGFSGDEYGLTVSGDGTLQFELGIVGSYDPLETVDRTLAFDTWVHVAGTWDGTTMRTYINGILLGSQPVSRPTVREEDSFIVGSARLNNPYERWRGQIDEVRIWNIARSEEQIRSSSATGLFGDELGLVGYWAFDDGMGQSAKDSTPNHLDLQLGETPGVDSLDPVWVSSDIPGFQPAAISKGRIEFARSSYPCSSTMTLTVRDSDLIEATTTVVLKSLDNSDMETVTLSAVGDFQGLYSGYIPVGTGAPASENGVLETVDSDAVRATYADADNGNGVSSTATATAIIDCSPPELIDHQIQPSQNLNALIRIESNEPTRLTVRYAPDCGSEVVEETTSSVLSTVHEILIPELNSSTIYHYEIQLTDRTGNRATYDNEGSCYSFRTPTVFPPRILAFTKFVDRTPEFNRTIEALESELADYELIETENESPAELESLLSNADVFLIPEQETWTVDGMNAWADSISPVLDRFVRGGGAVITLDDGPDSHSNIVEFLSRTKLMTINDYSSRSTSSRTCDLRFPEHPILESVGNPFMTIGGSFTFIADSTGDIIAGVEGSEYGIVAAREIDRGGAVLIGWDFNNYNDDMALILANAVRWKSLRVTREGEVLVQSNVISCSSELRVELRDIDLIGLMPTIEIMGLTGGDLETLVLTEDNTFAGVFYGAIDIAVDPVTTSDQTLQVSDEEVIDIVYLDTDVGTGMPGAATASVRIDCSPPELLKLQVHPSQNLNARIRIESNEPSLLTLRYAPDCGSEVVEHTTSSVLNTVHEILIPELNSSTIYHYEIELTDGAGNRAIHDNGGSCYSFRTPTVFPPRILAFTKFVDRTPEFNRTIEALDTELAVYELTETETEDPAELEILLNNTDVFLIPEQEQWTVEGMNTWADAISDVLDRFVRKGGAVIATDDGPDSRSNIVEFLNLTRLLPIHSFSSRTSSSRSCDLRFPNHPILEEVSSPFSAIGGSFSFVTETPEYIIAGISESENGIVATREIDRGGVVLIGWDFNGYNEDMAHILANAVRWKSLRVTSEGEVLLRSNVVSCSDRLLIELRDIDLVGTTPTVKVKNEAGGDLESIVLIEDPTFGGVFHAEIGITGDPISSGDGTLQVGQGDQISITYHDADPGNGVATDVFATAEVDCMPPSITMIEGPPPSSLSFDLLVETDEPTQVRIHYGLSCEFPTEMAESTKFSKNHHLTVSGLTPLTRYFYTVEATDRAGNLTTDDNGGECRIFSTGLFSYALSFEGAQFAIIPHQPILNLSGNDALTLEAWVRRTSNSPYWQVAFTKGSSGGHYGLTTSGVGSLQFELSGNQLETSGGLIQLNTWTHIAGTWDGSTMRTYVNGVFQNSHSYSGSMRPQNAPFVVGSSNAGSTIESWQGQIDEVRIWNTARSGAQIRSTSTTEDMGDQLGLVGYWSFNEGGGQVSGDSTPNELDLQLGSSSNPDNQDPMWVFSDIPSIRPPITGLGTVSVDASAYRCSDRLEIELRDLDLIGLSASIDLVTTPGGDAETLTLSEDPDFNGFFYGDITLVNAPVSVGDGILQVVNAETIVATYQDFDGGGGIPNTATATAKVDCIPPSATHVGTVETTTFGTTFNVRTDEPTQATVRYASTCGLLSESVVSREFSNVHNLGVEGLISATEYFYIVELTDRAGNSSLQNNSGICYSFVTIRDVCESGYYVLDALGGRHRVGNPPTISGALYFGVAIARDMERSICGEDQDIVVLDGNGVAHFVANSSCDINQDFYLDSDPSEFPHGRAVDVVMTLDNQGFWVLTDYGAIYRAGSAREPGMNALLPSSDRLGVLGSDIPLNFGRDPNFPSPGGATLRAVSFIVFDVDDDSVADAYIVLDSQGGRFHIQPDGSHFEPGSLTGFPVNRPFRLWDPAGYAWPYFRGLDIARDMELDPTQIGVVIFDGWGGIHPVPVDVESNPVYFANNRVSNSDPTPRQEIGMPYITKGFDDPATEGIDEGDSSLFGVDAASIFADLELATCSGGLYTMDRYGSIFTFGSARKLEGDVIAPFNNSPYFFPFRDAVDMEIYPIAETEF